MLAIRGTVHHIYTLFYTDTGDYLQDCFLFFIFDKYDSETRRKAEPSFGGHDPRTAVQLRSLSTVLKRLKEIMEGKSQVLSRGFRLLIKQLYGACAILTENSVMFLKEKSASTSSSYEHHIFTHRYLVLIYQFFPFIDSALCVLFKKYLSSPMPVIILPWFLQEALLFV